MLIFLIWHYANSARLVLPHPFYGGRTGSQRDEVACYGLRFSVIIGM